jgi:serine-type D-Ala-D-Ala carboxypeptidase/endopeptidase (penicillin-binding protein 4)
MIVVPYMGRVEQKVSTKPAWGHLSGGLAALTLFLASTTFGQQPTDSFRPRLARPDASPMPAAAAPAQAAATPQPDPNSNSQPGPPVARPAYLTAVHGLQGVLAETLDGQILAAQSEDEAFNPASSVKLATALAALETFGPQYRFEMTIWANGKIDPLTGALDGDLIVSGRDPSFHYEHAVMLALELNRLGIHAVTGDLIVSPGFAMNFDWSAKRSGEQLYNTLDSSRRSAKATQAWIDERLVLSDKASLQTLPSVAVLGGVYVANVPAGASLLATHKSSKLVDILKVLLCYSNNFMAERIGDSLGGPKAVRQILLSRLGIDPAEVMLSSTSGVGINRVTPRAMMKILRALREELAKNKLSPSDIMPVAGIDPGTLEERYTALSQKGSVIAKTGTLGRTDGGASSLVGQMQTRSGKVVLFVIFNQHGNVLRFRNNQDEIVTQIQNTLGGPAPFAYRPVGLVMRLAETEDESAKINGEDEPPKNNNQNKR